MGVAGLMELVAKSGGAVFLTKGTGEDMIVKVEHA